MQLLSYKIEESNKDDFSFSSEWKVVFICIVIYLHPKNETLNTKSEALCL